jgi:predicted alpha/beta-fold hydrolase
MASPDSQPDAGRDSLPSWGPFRARFPWWGGDLQTVRDSIHPPELPPDRGQRVTIALAGTDQLLARVDGVPEPRGWVVLVHGLGGNSDGPSLRRLALVLQDHGLTVVRLNLRGAGEGRPLARGSYAARCDQDVLAALAWARLQAGSLPLFAVGLSLGGTVLLNALLTALGQNPAPGSPLEGLACVSSPLDLEACLGQMERRRNAPYQRWLLGRLVREVSQDPGGLAATDQQALRRALGLGSIRAFDAAITAPRWGYPSVGAYYAAASPLPTLLAVGAETSKTPLPPLLLLQAADDPWVPTRAMEDLAARLTGLASESPAMGRFPSLLISTGGGHNGFHGQGDGRHRHRGTWADRAVATWLVHQGQRYSAATA